VEASVLRFGFSFGDGGLFFWLDDAAFHLWKTLASFTA